MVTHTIEITDIPDDLLQRMDSQVRAGQAADRSEYVRGLLRKDLAAQASPKDEKTMAEILAPIHESVQASGMTPDAVNALLDATLADVRRERRQRRQSESRGGHEKAAASAISILT